MNSIEIIITSALIVSGLSLMIIRDYRNMRRATRKDKNLVEQFINELDSHDPTCYDQFIATDKGEGDCEY